MDEIKLTPGRANGAVALTIIVMTRLPLLAETIDQIGGPDVVRQATNGVVRCEIPAQTTDPFWSMEFCRVPFKDDGAVVNVCVLFVSFWVGERGLRRTSAVCGRGARVHRRDWRPCPAPRV
jgi:hypothetical protein